MIPQLDPATGYLPFQGEAESDLYSCAETEFRQRFTFNSRRISLYEHWQLWKSSVVTLFPDARFWLSGSYVSAKPLPHDIDVVFVVPQAKDIADRLSTAEAGSLITLQGVSAHTPTCAFQRLQPVAGKIDGFFALDWVSANKASWLAQWTREYDKQICQPTGVRKGMLEVTA